jgi:glycosyltransferase involved in cell wall biosynthesis
LPEKYVLSVGKKNEYKNISRVVEAWCQGEFPEDLVLLADFDPNILRIAEKHNRGHRIFFVRSIPDCDLSMLYSLAKMFVYPSLHEGFALPPLEAAACEVPLVASQVSAIPEMLGDAAVYFNPTNTTDIVRAMCDYFNAPQEKVQYNLKKGLEQTQRFSWKRMAEDSLALCREVCQ